MEESCDTERATLTCKLKTGQIIHFLIVYCCNYNEVQRNLVLVTGGKYVSLTCTLVKNQNFTLFWCTREWACSLQFIATGFYQLSL